MSGPIANPAAVAGARHRDATGGVHQLRRHRAARRRHGRPQVRAFADDEAWGERTLTLIERALPLLEEEIGLPYPRVGSLVADRVGRRATPPASARTASGGTEILVALRPAAVHRAAPGGARLAVAGARRVPLDPRGARQRRSPQRVASELEVEPPYDPSERPSAARCGLPARHVGARSADPRAEAYGYAASWASIVGAAARRSARTRSAPCSSGSRASIGPYAETDVDADPPADGCTAAGRAAHHADVPRPAGDGRRRPTSRELFARRAC